MDFKQIRNKLRTFSLESVSSEIITLLHWTEKNKKYRLPIWHLLLLLKWNYEFVPKKIKTKNATKEDIQKLLKQIEILEISNCLFTFNGKPHIQKPFIIMAHQQFIYQNEVFWDTFARQHILFCELKSKYRIDDSFKNLTKIDLNIFIKISFTIWLFTFKSLNPKYKCHLHFFNQGFLSEKDYNFLVELFNKKDINNYLKLLSFEEKETKNILENDNRILKDYNSQPFEQSIFTRRPYLKFQDKLTLPHKDILKHNFTHFIYEYLKNNDTNFTTEFGLRMEKYVKIGLDETNIDYITEKELEKKIGLHNNLVDFVVDKNILIEVKAIEIKPFASVNPKDEILANEFRKNLVKAYAKQMINVANKLGASENYYGIIITYKKLFLGNSKDIWEQFLKEETLKIREEKELNILPYENLFFIDITSWDLLIEIIKSKKYSLIQILNKIKETDSNHKTRKFNFSMHLEQDFNFEKVNTNYLLESYKKLDVKNAYV
ncbi:hypothetical protein G1J88_11880 [Tenacibaculum dicentrarchi]|nr:hypothetical protein [Tenacibaculum dicentrarchi]MCD8421240.1 hypothetical protein [Tenacibaculum dicentrarchi]MCD8438398.1 hypothetical protein [Tenacibaculum dicentrarchi]MCG8829079.1 hypothetical protein [Tenacibaculum dicentrarchi]WBX67956.1 hypothetical protein PG910_07410 [Tenacibaculum dicentrarchi]